MHNHVDQQEPESEEPGATFPELASFHAHSLYVQAKGLEKSSISRMTGEVQMMSNTGLLRNDSTGMFPDLGYFQL